MEIQLIELWLTNVLCRYQIIEKKEQYGQLTLFNGFSARGYSIRGIHLPTSPFNVIAYDV